MRTRLIALALLLLTSGIAHAGDGDVPFKKQYFLEIGAGPGPFHTRTLGFTQSTKHALAKQGREAEKYGTLYPAVSVSAGCRTASRWEIVLTGGLSWCHSPITQYEIMGYDPYGEPRYDVEKGSPAGWMDLSFIGSLTLQGRYFWIPEKAFELYSAFGLGLTTATDYIPIPSLTPIAARYGGKHFYVFAETALNPIALYSHGGIGLRF